MAKPLLPTPKVVSQGSVSKPQPQPRVSFQGPLRETPRVVGAGTLSKPKNPW
jgi:hypothetical protein